MKATSIPLLGDILSAYDSARRKDAAALTVLEVRELENIFALLLIGSFVGIPAPPSFISVELIPHMEEELRNLERRAEDASDMFAEMVGTFGID